MLTLTTYKKNIAGERVLPVKANLWLTDYDATGLVEGELLPEDRRAKLIIRIVTTVVYTSITDTKREVPKAQPFDASDLLSRRRL